MERIKEFVLGASQPAQKYFWNSILVHARDFRTVGFVALVFLAAFSVAKHKQNTDSHLIDIISLYNIKVARPPATQVKSNANFNSVSKVNVEELISKATPYSYSETQLGFYLKDFDFFNTNPKLKVEKRILASLPRDLSKNARRYVRAVLRISEKHQVDPIWVLSVMWTESHFKFKAISHAGARGLMQIMPTTKKYIYRSYVARGKQLEVERDNFNLDFYFPYAVEDSARKTHISKLINIELGVIYLKRLLKYFDRNHIHATVAYNMGPGWTRGRLDNNLPVGKKNQYLTKVQKAYKRIVKKI